MCFNLGHSAGCLCDNLGRSKIKPSVSSPAPKSADEVTAILEWAFGYCYRKLGSWNCTTYVDKNGFKSPPDFDGIKAGIKEWVGEIICERTKNIENFPKLKVKWLAIKTSPYKKWQWRVDFTLSAF